MARSIPDRAGKRPTCSSGKAAYPTRGRAMSALRHIEIDNAQAAVPMPVAPRSPYKCHECGWWHLTKRSPSSRA